MAPDVCVVVSLFLSTLLSEGAKDSPFVCFFYGIAMSVKSFRRSLCTTYERRNREVVDDKL